MEFAPVIPFEPVSVSRIPSGSEWIAQVKWDGVRMLAYRDGNETRLFNRKRNDRSVQYPEFLTPTDYCSATRFIIDGEFIAFDANKPSFREMMTRDGLRTERSIRQAVDRVPVTYMVFDVLFVEKEWVVDKPLDERLALLRQIIKPSDRVQIAQNFADMNSLWKAVKDKKMEGIVCKDLGSKYLVSGKDSRWRKLKTGHDLLAVVGGFSCRDRIVNSLYLGAYSQGNLIFIGQAGAGKLTVPDWKELTSRVESLTIETKPFANKPEKTKGATWVKPRIVVKVRFLEWTSGKTMRQPVIQSVVESAIVSECILNNE